MNLIVFFCLIMTNSVWAEAEQHIQILKKKEMDQKKLYLDRAAIFEDFINRTSLLVDRSLFIKVLVERSREGEGPIAITAPRRWGKSSLLSMMRFFFEPVLDGELKIMDSKLTPAYEYFKNGKMDNNAFDKAPLISKNDEIIDNYLAKHPVIHLDLSKLTINSPEEYKQTLWTLGPGKFKVQYAEIFDHICETKKNAVGKNISRKFYGTLKSFCNKEDMMKLNNLGYLETIIDVLYMFFEKPVVILVDEYDKPIQKMLQLRKDGIPKHIAYGQKSTLNEFYGFLVKCPEQCMKRYIVLLTGVVPISLGELDSEANTVIYKHYLDDPFYDFYGIPNYAVEQLFQHYKTNETAKKLCLSYYGNYAYNSEIFLYNPFSLLQAVSTGDYGLYWKKNGVFTNTRDIIINYEQRRNMLYNLVVFKGKRRCELASEKFEKIQFQELEDMVTKSNGSTDLKYDVFLEYLYHGGYLNKVQEGVYYYTIPNFETMAQLQEVFGYMVDFSRLQNASYQLFNLIEDHKKPIENFRSSFLEYINDKYKVSLLSACEMVFHFAVMNVAEHLYSVNGFKFSMNYPLTTTNAIKSNRMIQQFPDVLLQNESHAAIIEVKFNLRRPFEINDAEVVQLGGYGIHFHAQHPEIGRVILILIHINETNLKIGNEKNRWEVEMRTRSLCSEEDYENLNQTIKDYEAGKKGTTTSPTNDPVAK